MRVPALALDELLAVAGVDPRAGMQVVAADRLVSIPFDPGLPLVILRTGTDAPPPATTTRRTAADGETGVHKIIDVGRNHDAGTGRRQG